MSATEMPTTESGAYESICRYVHGAPAWAGCSSHSRRCPISGGVFIVTMSSRPSPDKSVNSMLNAWTVAASGVRIGRRELDGVLHEVEGALRAAVLEPEHLLQRDAAADDVQIAVTV